MSLSCALSSSFVLFTFVPAASPLRVLSLQAVYSYTRFTNIPFSSCLSIALLIIYCSALHKSRSRLGDVPVYARKPREMQRLRISKSRPELAGRNRSIRGARSVHLQFIDAADATRDAHIAASKAFVLSQERCTSDTPPALFPDPQCCPLVPLAQSGSVDGLNLPAGIHRCRSMTQPHSSIRFIQQDEQSVNESRIEGKCAAVPFSNPTMSATSQIDPHSQETRTTNRQMAASESNYSQYSSSLPSTPVQKQRISKTWSGSQLRSKENVRDAAILSRTRNTVHIGTSPRHTTTVSLRQWPRPPSQNNVRDLHRKTTAETNPPVTPFSEVEDSSIFAKRQNGQLGSIAGGGVHSDQTPKSPRAIRIRRPPLPPASPLQRGDNVQHLHRHFNKEGIQGGALPDTSITTSKSYLRPHHKRSFSFSSNDDERFTAVSSNVSSSQKRYSLRSPRREEKCMKKSLRQSRPLPSRPSVLPHHSSDTTDIGVDENNGVYVFTGTGSLRRTASRMSNAVRTRLRSFWSNSKTESNEEQIPQQHIESSIPPGLLLSGQEFMLAREGRISTSNGFHMASEATDTGTVICGGNGGGADAARSEYSADTSRFTSWSSSVRRSSSDTGNHPSNDLESQHLPVISEGSDHPTPRATHQMGDRQARLMSPGIALGQLGNLEKAAKAFMSTDSLSSTASPSLASSGHGDTPGQGVAPNILHRLQELSLNLQRACTGDEAGQAQAPARERGANGAGDDLFYKDKHNTRFAFPSAATTPVETRPLPEQTSSQTGQEQDPMSPHCFFRGTTYRQALRESMKSFEEETSACRARQRDRDGTLGGQVDGCEVYDDAPLLHSDGAPQWMRVRAWQDDLSYDSSTKAESVRSVQPAMSPPTDRALGLRALVSENPFVSTTSLDEGRASTPRTRPAHLEWRHRDTALSPEQLHSWVKDGGDMW